MATVPIGADPRPSGLSLEASQYQQILEAVLHLDTWFETQRQPSGYGGAVVHWWWDNLDFTAPGLDWRYEGILIGYLNLYAAGVKGKDQRCYLVGESLPGRGRSVVRPASFR